MNETHHSALELAEMGIPCFPCKPGSKEPAIADWDERATTDRDQIEHWFKLDQGRNLAAAVPEHMVVVDLEGKARAEVEGIMGKRFPDTMASATPGRGGGEHLWFTRDPSHPIRNRVKLFGASGPHVDIRTKGGYVIVPPSLHPSGKRYRWANEHRIEKAPDWLIEMCTRSSQNNGDLEPIMTVKEMIAGVPMGMQRWAMFRFACSRRAKGYDPDEVKLILWGAAQSLEQDKSRPWKRDHVNKLVDDVWSRYEAPKEPTETGPGRMWTPNELSSHTWPTDKWIVESLLRRGVTVLSSHAKTGKSMLVSTLLKSVALGEPVWGRFPSKKSGVLCLDLEQDEEAAAGRWEKIMGNADLSNLRVFFSWPRMHKGGLDEIRNFLMANADVGVVVIDTWAMFNPARAGDDSAGLNEYYREYDVLGKLKRIANEMGVAILVVHHFSKNTERPSGTAAFEGAPDGDWRLHREAGSSFAVLKSKGKNMPETSITFAVDMRKFEWRVTNVS